MECATVGTVQLPTLVGGTSQGLAIPRAELAADMSADVGGRTDLPKHTSPGPGPKGPKGGGGQWEGRGRGGGVKGRDGS